MKNSKKHRLLLETDENKAKHFAHITRVHPCFNEKIHDKVGRIHIPIAPTCNIQCNFCSRKLDKCENRPGVSSCIMSVSEAMDHIQNITETMPITVIGVAGPGDSLCNDNTLKLFEQVHEKFPNLIMCMSTNGLLLPNKAQEIAAVGVKTVTVTVNAIDSEIGKEIYDHIIYEGNEYKGVEAFNILVKNQLDGIELLSKLNIIVKVNTVLIPGVNDEHILDIARTVHEKGASLMNVLPLIPLNKFENLKAPSCGMLSDIRDEVEKIIPVFRACTQCRADAYGIPGNTGCDDDLDLTPNSHY